LIKKDKMGDTDSRALDEGLWFRQWIKLTIGLKFMLSLTEYKLH